MNREQITEALKMYRSYKVGIAAYERVQINNDNWNPFVASACRVAVYSDTPLGTGSGSKQPTLTGGWSLEDHMEYQNYCETVKWIDVALDSLTTDERHVITLKWMDGLTLRQISERTPYSERTVKTIHGRSLDKMYACLRFVDKAKAYTPVA